MDYHKVTWLVLSGLGLCFLLSLALYLFNPFSLTRTVFFFPHKKSGLFCPEVRALALTKDQEANAELIVKEILLGPYQHQNLRLFPRAACVKTVLARKQTIYVDLTLSSLLPDLDVPYAPLKALEILKKTLLYHFKSFSEVIITIEGQFGLSKMQNSLTNMMGLV